MTPQRCQDSNRSGRCPRKADREWEGVPVCARHLGIRTRETRIRKWVQQGNRCPLHPGTQPRTARNGRTIRCPHRDPLPCEWTAEVPEQVRSGPTPMELLLQGPENADPERRG